MTKSMMTRRAALRGLAFVPAAGGVAMAAQSIAADNTLHNSLAELMADFRWKDAEWDAAEAEVTRLHRENFLPPVQVAHGRRRFLNEETGEITWGQWIAHSERDIMRHYPTGGVFTPEQNADLLRKREEVLAAFRTAEKRRYDAEAACGITAAETMSEAAYKARCAAMDAIFAYQPATIDEMAVKHAYLAGKLAEGYDFEDEELAAIFGAARFSASHV